MLYMQICSTCGPSADFCMVAWPLCATLTNETKREHANVCRSARHTGHSTASTVLQTLVYFGSLRNLASGCTEVLGYRKNLSLKREQGQLNQRPKTSLAEGLPGQVLTSKRQVPPLATTTTRGGAFFSNTAAAERGSLTPSSTSSTTLATRTDMTRRCVDKMCPEVVCDLRCCGALFGTHRTGRLVVYYELSAAVLCQRCVDPRWVGGTRTKSNCQVPPHAIDRRACARLVTASGRPTTNGVTH